MRAVYDLGNLGESLWMPATGQSGNPLSPHFLDLAERWRNFDYLRIAGNRDDALAEAEGVLMLIPDDPR
jgi:penicillin amidase